MKRKYKKKTNPVFAGTILMIVILLAFGATLFDKGEAEEKQFGDIGNADIPVVEDTGDDSLEANRQKLELVMINVEQGLSCLVDFGEFEVLYDGGYADYGKKVSEDISSYVDGSIEYVICSHLHADHAGGLTRILKDYSVEKVIYSGGEADSSESEAFLDAVKNEAGCRMAEDSDTTISLGNSGDAQMQIIETMDPGEGDEDGDGITDNLNNLSVVCYITYGEQSILLEGDAEETEEKCLKGKIPGGVTFMAAGHHGSDTSNTLLTEWSPEVFAVSCAKKNDYGHPSKKVLTEAALLGCDIYTTYKNGNITFVTDGVDWEVKTEKGSELDVD